MPSSWKPSLLLVLVTALGCPAPVEPPPPPSAGPLRAQVATRALDVPVGVPMGGYTRNRRRDEPGSPWSQSLPASRGVHTEPTARVLALSNGVTTALIARVDTCLTSPTLRSRVLAGLAEAGLDAKLLLVASHTHAGPARIMPPARIGSSTGSDFIAFVMDTYDAEVEARMAAAVVAAAKDTLSNLQPVALGVARADGSAFNSDRRCANDPVYGPDFRDTDFTVLRLDALTAEGGRPLAALVHFAVHGTVLGEGNTLLSTEVTGAIELHASDALGVPVLHLQGSAGDVSPRGSPLGHEGLQLLERQGRAAAARIADAFAQATPLAPPSAARLEVLERGMLLTREALGYAPGEFANGPAIQCAAGQGGTCGSVKSTPAEVSCIPLEPQRPFRTALTTLRVEDVLLASLPGEPSTRIGRNVVAALAPLDAGVVLPVGYAQDHYGYLLEEDDWLRGGYEPTVSPWGWKMGDAVVAEYARLAQAPAAEQPAPSVAMTQAPTPRTPAASTEPPFIVTQPESGERLSLHTLVFEGGDPGLGLPRVALEREVGGAFVAVMASPTRAVVNGPEVLLRYAATPGFLAEPEAPSRRHVWTAQFESVPDTPAGRYRFVARGEAVQGGQRVAYRLESEPFEVRPSTAGRVAATVRNDGRLAIDVRFPPNPAREVDGDPVGGWRSWDDGADPRVGARLRGGAVTARLTSPSGAETMATLPWDEAEGRFVGPSLGEFGAWTVSVAADGVRDAHGNSAQAATVQVSVL
jgi:neutral ceramidase